MSEVRHLKNAPIKEALIDIQIEYPMKDPIAAMSEWGKTLSEAYPKSTMRQHTQIKAVRGETPDVTETIDGYAFRSKNNRQIVQATRSGFTFSRLKPYENWDQLRSEAFRLWELYVEHFQPKRISRVATRYINELELPQPIEVNDYLTAGPVQLKSLPELVQSFFNRVVVPIPSLSASAIITQNLDTSRQQENISIILDIDIFRQEDLEIDSAEIWNTLDQFRDYKNSIFFECLTEKAIGLYI